MQITVHDDTRLVLHQGPWGLRGIGVLFAALGGIILWYITHGHLGEHNAWVAVVVGAAFAIAGLSMAVLAGDVLCTFDRSTRTATIQHRRLVNPGTESYAWSDISDVALEQSTMQTTRNGRGAPTYRPVFVMKSGTRVPWTDVYTSELKRQSNCVAAVRSFAGWHALSDDVRAADSVAIQAAAAGLRRVRLLLFPFLGIFVAVGATLCVSQVKRYLTWQPVQARIVDESIVSSSTDKGSVYRPVLNYAYRRGGDTVVATGTTIITISSSHDWAEAIARRYPLGKVVTAYVDPAHPTRGFVVRELSWFPLVFVIIPLVVGVVIARASQNGQQGLTLAGAQHVPILDTGGGTATVVTPRQPAPLPAS